jgi:hypothetical protein
MSFADPQSVTIVGGAVSLPRIGATQNAGTFQSADGMNRLSVSSSYGNRTRRIARLDLSKVAANPFDSSVNAKYSMSAYLVVDVPQVGYTTADEVTNAAGLLTWLSATTNAKLTQLMGGEN